MRNKKKKGFTLIELIAVIAILAILGAILVPKIGGYTKRARKSNVTASAKVIMNAVRAYNSDKSGTDLIKYNDTLADAVNKINTANGEITIKTADLARFGTTYDNVGDAATIENNGTFDVDSAGIVTSITSSLSSSTAVAD